jgi:hypothetical protein
VKTQIATTVDPDLLAKLTELAEVEETSIARILRRGARQIATEHERNTKRLVNGRTRAEETAKRKRQRGRAVATA